MKKKVLALIMAVAMVAGLTGCGSSANEASTEAAETKKEEKKAENVTLTLPADFVSMAGTVTQESLDEEVKTGEAVSATLNSDGTVTYVVTAEQHQKMKDEVKQSMLDGLAEFTKGEGTDEDMGIASITPDENFINYTVVLRSGFTDETLVDVIASITTSVFDIYGRVYSIFTGVDYVEATATFKDDAGTVIKELKSSDDEVIDLMKIVTEE